MSVSDLITCLEAIVACDEIEEKRILNWGNIEDRHKLIREAVDLADQVLVADGDRNYANERELANSSDFVVRPLEQDRFGWLTGGIVTSKGHIAYG
jgi:hypothetical protein